MKEEQESQQSQGVTAIDYSEEEAKKRLLAVFRLCLKIPATS